jgi:DUF917 family protein|tara:strand:- start:5008 stop:6093 length:1086 start_codon:yes stop_codon:yes gene_type:complete
VKIDGSNIDNFIRGAAFLGTGGGGDPYVGKLMLKQVLNDGYDITVLDPAEFPDEALAVNILTMGAPTVINEKLPSGDANLRALQQMEKQLGRKVDAVMPIEAGGINATIPLIVGALAKLPIIDADGMGRAFPELQMTTFNVAGLTSSPNIIADDKNSIVSVEAETNIAAERFCRDACVRMGGAGQMACYPLSGKDIRQHAIHNTISMAVSIGEIIETARQQRDDVFEKLIQFFTSPSVGRHAEILFDGKVIDVLRETKGGFSIGTVKLDSLSDQSQLSVKFQNEYLLAQKDTQVIAMVPDLICILDLETAEPITTENLRYGQRVKVIGISSPESMKSAEALAVFGPEGFNLDVEYMPLSTR